MDNNQKLDQYERLKKYYPPHEMESIFNATICVCGLGGVGGSCVEALARCGVKKLILVDYDTVDLTNLNRQIIATYETLGQPKTEAMKHRIEQVSKQTEVQLVHSFIDAEHVDFLDQPIDLVIDCIDSLDSKIELIKACKQRHIPSISSMGMGNRVDPSKIRVDKLEKTFNDPLSKVMREKAKKARLKNIKVVFSTELPIKTQKPPASTPFVPNAAGLLLASYAIEQVRYGKK